MPSCLLLLPTRRDEACLRSRPVRFVSLVPFPCWSTGPRSQAHPQLSPGRTFAGEPATARRPAPGFDPARRLELGYTASRSVARVHWLLGFRQSSATLVAETIGFERDCSHRFGHLGPRGGVLLEPAAPRHAVRAGRAAGRAHAHRVRGNAGRTAAC